MAWHGGATSKAGQVDRAERIVKALELRKLGLSYTVIAEKMGLPNRQEAHRLVQAGLESLPKEPAEELRTLELERLDVAMRGLMPKVARGDDKAVAAMVRIMQHRAKLTGLYDISVDNGQAAASDAFSKFMAGVQAGIAAIQDDTDNDE